MTRFKFVLFSFILLFVFGCSNQNQTEQTETPNVSESNVTQSQTQSPETPKAPQTPPEEPKEPIKLTFATPAGHTVENFNERFGNSIQKQFPQYEISFVPRSDVSFDNLIVTGTEVDIVFGAIIDYTRGPISFQMVEDMNELVKQHNVDLDRISVDWQEGMSTMWDGSLYGIPISLESNSTFYNKDLFDAFGVEYPHDYITWEEVFALNARLTRSENNVNYIGVAIARPQHFSLNGLSVPFIDPETGQSAFGVDEYAAKWRTLYETLVTKPAEASGYREKMIELGRLPSNTEFYNGEAAMFVGLTHTPLSRPDLEEMNWDMTTYPTYEGYPDTGAQGNLLLFGITKMSKHKDEAMEVIKYFISDEYQVETSRVGNIPIVINDETIAAFAQDTYYHDRNVESVFKLDFAPLPYRTIYDPLTTGVYYNQNTLFSIIMEDLDINTMMARMQEEANQRIAAEQK